MTNTKKIKILLENPLRAPVTTFSLRLHVCEKFLVKYDFLQPGMRIFISTAKSTLTEKFCARFTKGCKTWKFFVDIFREENVYNLLTLLLFLKTKKKTEQWFSSQVYLKVIHDELLSRIFWVFRSFRWINSSCFASEDSANKQIVWIPLHLVQ